MNDTYRVDAIPEGYPVVTMAELLDGPQGAGRAGSLVPAAPLSQEL